MTRFKLLLTVVVILALASPAAAAVGSLILSVPDWNQPSVAAYPQDGLPVNGYPGWCSPTAGGNLMGYWEDVMGCAGLTDGMAFAATPAYQANVNTWQQGLYHDGIVEMGWFMDTGNWQSTVPQSFPPNAGGTNTNNILPGLLNYAGASWTDDDFFGGQGSGIVKKSYTATGNTETLTPLGIMWGNYCAEIDAARPVEATFEKWVDTTGGPVYDTLNSQTVEYYPWLISGDPHSVVGVGYIDPITGYQGDGTEFFVCQDGWQTTGSYVAVPVDAVWFQNDYIYSVVPEPGTILLLITGGLGLMFAWRWRK